MKRLLARHVTAAGMLLASRLLADIIVAYVLAGASNGGVGVISTHAALSFTPSTRKTRHIESTGNILRSISIVVLLFGIRLSRPVLGGALLLSSDARVPANQAIGAIWETVKFRVLPQSDGE